MEKAINSKAYGYALSLIDRAKVGVINAVVHNKWLVVQLDSGVRLRVRN